MNWRCQERWNEGAFKNTRDEACCSLQCLSEEIYMTFMLSEHLLETLYYNALVVISKDVDKKLRPGKNAITRNLHTYLFDINMNDIVLSRHICTDCSWQYPKKVMRQYKTNVHLLACREDILANCQIHNTHLFTVVIVNVSWWQSEQDI